MNYLAHIFLSGADPELQVGNFVGDAVKGRAYLRYPKQIFFDHLLDLFSVFFPEVRDMCQKELVCPVTQMLNS